MKFSRFLALLGLLASQPAMAQVVDKQTNPATPVPRDAPRAYHLSPAKQRGIQQSRATLKHRDPAWAARQRRSIHEERGHYLRHPADQ